MTTGSSQDVLWIPLAELSRAGVIAPQLPDNATAAIRALDDGMAAVEANGALVCVILSPAAWQKIQATNTAWQRLFHWALRHIDTPTLRRMAATADTVLDRHPDRSAPWRQT